FLENLEQFFETNHESTSLLELGYDEIDKDSCSNLYSDNESKNTSNKDI
ncbi:18161_t:CDS:1, partial [Cetraspora pellucida]